MTAEHTADIAVLMPKITDPECFSVRYAGLDTELRELGVTHFFAETHDSFMPLEDSFQSPYDINRDAIARTIAAPLVRDLTMSLDVKPVYKASNIRTVHDPVTSRYIADKRNLVDALPTQHPATLTISETGVEMAFDMIPGNKIIIKPTIGHRSKDVQVINKVAGVTLGKGTYLAQEYLDTTVGMPEYDIEGIHNLRVLSIGNKAVAAIARLGGTSGEILQSDVYGNFVHPDDFTPTIHGIVESVHEVMYWQPGRGNNVLAIDVMRGRGSDGEIRDALCEVNRRPQRISSWDLLDTANRSPSAIIEVAQRWDQAEAEMLAGLVR